MHKGAPGGTSDRARLLAAIAKYAPTVQAMAEKRYGISGAALIAKTLQGESAAISDPSAAKGKVSSAGARGWAQFMPSSRREAIKKFGIDPWSSPEEAVHAMTLHLRGKINGSTGLEGYNPGDPNYPKYILAQKVGDVHALAGDGASSGGTLVGGSSSPAASALGGAFDPGQRGSLSQMLQTATQPAPVQGSLPALPDFAAGPVMPEGYRAPSSGGGPAPPPALQLPQLSDLGHVADVGSGAPTAEAAMFDSGGGGGGGGGRVKGAKAGDPVVGGTSIGGEHETMGLPGYPARDYFAKAGSAAVAPVSGKVIKLSGHDPKNGPTNGPHGPLGWSVYIKGSDGRRYFLTHLGSRTVKVGQSVEAGEEIGTVANYDKYGTPSHVHMGVRGGR